MEKDTIDHFQELGQKLQLLLKQQEALLREKRKMRLELDAALMEKEVNQKLIQELTMQLEAMKAASLEKPEADREHLEKRLQEYIRHIDQVIQHLQNA